MPAEHYWIANIASLLCAITVGRFVRRRMAAPYQSLLSHMVRGAFIVGGIGFVGGFFGPMIFAPGANQRPLLGLLITGPLGFLIGGLANGFARTSAAQRN